MQWRPSIEATYSLASTRKTVLYMLFVVRGVMITGYAFKNSPAWLRTRSANLTKLQENLYRKHPIVNNNDNTIAKVCVCRIDESLVELHLSLTPVCTGAKCCCVRKMGSLVRGAIHPHRFASVERSTAAASRRFVRLCDFDRLLIHNRHR